jgi:hypothetical protein
LTILVSVEWFPLAAVVPLATILVPLAAVVPLVAIVPLAITLPVIAISPIGIFPPAGVILPITPISATQTAIVVVASISGRWNAPPKDQRTAQAQNNKTQGFPHHGSIFFVVWA